MAHISEAITSRTNTHPLHSETSRVLTSSLSLGVPVPRSNQVSVRRVDRTDTHILVFSIALALSIHNEQAPIFPIRSHSID